MVALATSLALLSYLVWMPKWSSSIPAWAKACLNLCLASALVLLYSWKSEGLAEDPSVRTMFTREIDRPLDSLHAIIKLSSTLELADLKEVAAVVILAAQAQDYSEKGIVLSANSVLADPSFGVGPPWGTEVPGLSIGTWSYPLKTAIRRSFVWKYPHGLDRIEMGSDDLVGNPIMTTVGDLNRSIVHVLATNAIATRAEHITIVANNFVLWSYQVNRTNKWKAHSENDVYLSSLLPSSLKRVDWLELSATGKEVIPTVNFANQRVRRYPLVDDNLPRGLVSHTLLPGARGWLPREDGSY